MGKNEMPNDLQRSSESPVNMGPLGWTSPEPNFEVPVLSRQKDVEKNHLVGGFNPSEKY